MYICAHRPIVGRYGYDLRRGRHVAALSDSAASYSKKKEFFYPFTNTTYSIPDGLTVASNPLGCARFGFTRMCMVIVIAIIIYSHDTHNRQCTGLVSAFF